MRSHAGRRRERRVHQHHGRAGVAQPVGDGLGVESGDHGLGKQVRQQPRPRGRVFVEMEIAGGGIAQRALRHYRQHAGAGGGLQHEIARPDRGGLERGIGQRQWGRELLEPDLFFRAPGVGGLKRGDGLQHRQHAAWATGAGVAAHAPAVALHEDHDGRFDGFVSVLPDPGAPGVRGAEGLRHGVPERRGVERTAGLQHGQQGSGRGVEGIARDRPGWLGGRVGWDGGGKRTREGVRRLRGVEHGRSPCWKGGGGRTVRVLPRRPAGLPPAG